MAAEPQEFTLSDVTAAALDVLPSAVRTAVAHAPDASEPFGPPSASLEVQVSALQARLATALATARKAGPAPSSSHRATRSSARAGAAGSEAADETEARNATEAVALLSAAHSALTDCDAALRRGRADAAVGSLSKARDAVDRLGSLTDEEEEAAARSRTSRVAAALPGARRALRALRDAITTRQARVAHAAATLWDGCFAIAAGAQARQLVEQVRAAGVDEAAAARGAADDLDAADSDASLLDALVSGVAAVLHVQGPRLPGAGAAGVPSSPSPAWALALLGRVGLQHQAAAVAGSASSLSSSLLAPALAGELGLVPVSLPVARRNRDECLIAAISATSASSSSSLASSSGHDATAATVSRVGRTLRLVADAMEAGEQGTSAEERSQAAAAAARLLAAVWWGHALDEDEFREDGDEDEDDEGGDDGMGESKFAAGGADRVPPGWKGLAPSRQALEGAAEEALDAADAASALDQGSGLALALVRALSDGCPERVADAGTLQAAADSAVALEQWVLRVLGAAAASAALPGVSGSDHSDEAAEWHSPALLAAVAADLPHHAAVARRQRVLARARDICVGSGFAAAVPVGEASPAAPGTVTALVGAGVAATPGDAAAAASGAGGGTAADARTVRVTPDGDWEDDGWAQAWEEPSPAEQPAPHPLAVDDAAIAAARAGPTAEDEAAAAGAAGAAAAAAAPDGADGSTASLRVRVQHARLHAALDLRSARVTATPFFRLAACSVSQAAADILELVRETLLEAASLGAATTSAGGGKDDAESAMPAAARERAAAILFHAARDCITVYRAVVPAAFGEELARSPRAAALVHNDCLFLAHHAVTLCLRVQSSLPGALRSTATFADMVPPLRELAERCLVTQVRAQREALRAALRTPLGPAGHPLGPDTPWKSVGQSKPSVDVDACAGRGPEALDAVLERPVQRALALVDSVAGVWAGVLPCRVFRAAIAHLLDTLLSSLAAAVLSAQFLPRPVAAGCAAALALVVDKVPLVVAADEATAAGAGGAHAASLRLSEPALHALIPQLARSVRVQELTAAVGSGGVAALEAALRARPAGELFRPPTDDAGPLSRIEAARLVRAAEVSPDSGDGAARTADVALQDRRQAVEDELLE